MTSAKGDRSYKWNQQERRKLSADLAVQITTSLADPNLQKEFLQAHVDAWKTTITGQMHFNDMEMRTRNFAVTVFAAAVSAAAPVVGGSQARTGKPGARNLVSRLGRHVREQFNWLRLAVGGFLAILAPWSLFASLQNPRHLNALMLVTTWLDFRSAGECAGLENQRFQIASLPNVDTDVIVARCVVGACDLPVLRLVVAPSTDKLVSFTREECRRRVTPHEAPSSKHAGPVDAGQAADAGSAPKCDSVPMY
jgi:hypothetical protein